VRLSLPRAFANGNGEYEAQNENNSPAYSAALFATWERSVIFVTGRQKTRTVGELPFRQTEEGMMRRYFTGAGGRYQIKDQVKDLDPPGPNPHRCMQVGAAAARVMAESPWRVAFVASSSWSHSFLTEKNWQLWPDVAADRRLYDALESGDYAAWHRYTTDQIEESGQHEVLNWFCLLGAMEELGRKPDKATFIESWAFVSPVVFAYYH